MTGQRPHSRSQLFVGDRLDHVVVGARVEAAHDRVCISPSGVEEHRSVTAVSPQLLQNLKPVSVAQLQIEDDAVVLVDECEGARFFARRSGIDGIALVAQYARNQLQYRLVIIDYENSHPVSGSGY